MFVTVVFTLQQRELDNRRAKQDFQIEENRRNEDQRQADELHYQDIFKTYMEDISNILFRPNQTNGFVDNRTKSAYIRSKTLTALEELDSQRRTRLFLFFYENNLLPRVALTEENDMNLSLDLSGANLSKISIKSIANKKIIFNKLSLPSVDLTDATFIGCQFRNGADFRDSVMTDAKFIRSTFDCSNPNDGAVDSLIMTHVFFDRSDMERANFSGSSLCDVSFDGVNLAYASFVRTTIRNNIQFEGANLKEADFRQTLPFDPLWVTFVNTNLLGSLFDNALVSDINAGSIVMKDVIFSNGSWSMNESNLILNAGAEIDVSSESFIFLH